MKQVFGKDVFLPVIEAIATCLLSDEIKKNSVGIYATESYAQAITFFLLSLYTLWEEYPEEVKALFFEEDVLAPDSFVSLDIFINNVLSYLDFCTTKNEKPVLQKTFLPSAVQRLLCNKKRSLSCEIAHTNYVASLYAFFSKIQMSFEEFYLFVSGLLFMFYDKKVLCIESQFERKHAGRYYTPKSLADVLSTYGVKHVHANTPLTKWTVIDNACGIGVFLVSFVDALCAELCSNTEKLLMIQPLLEEGICREKAIERCIFKQLVYGIDIDAIAVAITYYTLQKKTYIEGYPLVECRNHFRVGNALFALQKTDVVQMITQFCSLESLAVDCFFQAFSLLYTTTQQEQEISSMVQHILACAIEELPVTEYKLHMLYSFALLLFIYYSRQLPKQWNIMLSQCIQTLTIAMRENTHNFLKILEEFTENTPLISSLFNGIQYEILFPDIFQNESQEKGFGMFLGNPPWDKVRFEETLFFDQFFTSYGSKFEEDKQRLQLLLDAQKKEQQTLWKEKLSFLSACYKTLFPYSRGNGDDNLYRFFLELSQPYTQKGILQRDALLCVVLPWGFLTEEGSLQLRKRFFTEYSPCYCIGFENRKQVFPDVDARYKWGIFCVRLCKGKKANLFKFSAMQEVVQALEKYSTFILHTQEIANVSHETFALPELRTKEDLSILHRLYQQFPSLDPTYITLRRELDCVAHRALFKQEQNSYTDIPLFQGSMINQYNASFKPPTYYVSSQALDALMQSKEVFRCTQDLYNCIPQTVRSRYARMKKRDLVYGYFSLSAAECVSSLIHERLCWRFAVRCIARNTDERSTIAAFLPLGVTMQNSLSASIGKVYVYDNGIVVRATSLVRQCFVLAVLNSLTYDWMMRFLSAINISKAALHRIPFPQFSDSIILKSYRKLIENTLLLHGFYTPKGFEELFSYYDSLEEKIQKTTYTPLLQQLPQSLEEVLFLQCENDSIVAELYGLDKRDLEHIIRNDYFAVLHKKKKHYIETLLDMHGKRV